MRHQKYLLIIVTIFSVIALFAQAKVNFSGQWTFNQEKSKLDEMGPAFLPAAMVVTQVDNELTVQKTFKSDFAEDFTAEEKMTLDGQECKSEFWNSPRVTTAVWTTNGDTLKIDSKTTFNMDGQTNEMTLKEKWALAEDGKVLLIDHYSSSNFGERKITIAYSKVEEQPQQPSQEEKK
jgi:hypothetical protein